MTPEAFWYLVRALVFGSLLGISVGVLVSNYLGLIS